MPHFDMRQSKQKGFSAVLIIIIIFVVAGSLGLLFLFKQSFKSQEGNPQKFTPLSTENEAVDAQPLQGSDDEPPVRLKSIGVNLDYYDSKTNRAGDFVFTKEKLQFDRLFMPYGFVIPQSSAGAEKSNPQPTFILPIGTPVRSLIDGVVANIPVLWSKDYSIQVTTDGKLQKWVYETEHVINVKVKVGDKVTAGQIVGEASDFSSGAPAGFAAVEIGLLKGGNPPEHICPFNYLDLSIKEDIQMKITALFKSWEEYRGDANLYDESSFQNPPGCLTNDSIEG